MSSMISAMTQLRELGRRELSIVPPARIPRDAFAWSTAAALAALLPVGLQLEAWLGPLLILLAVLGASAGLRGVQAPALLRLILTLGIAGLVMYVYGFRFGRDTGAGLLATMLALKLLETQRLRDARTLLSFSLFAIMAAFLQDQGPITLGLSLVAMVLVLTALARVSELETGEPEHAPDARQRLGTTGVLLLLSLPLALAGFLLFPRLPRPLWGLPDNAVEARTGLSDSMEPGDISELFLDDTPLMRVEFRRRLPGEAERYWRGPVLSDFDGRRWEVSPWTRQLKPAALQPSGEVLEYELQLEPTDRRWVLGLDLPLEPTDGETGLGMNRDRSLRARQPLIEITRHNLRSDPGALLDVELPANLQSYLSRLPGSSNPRTAELIADWQARGLDGEGVMREALQWFNREFTYSLTPPPLGRHSVDEFLFQTREGYCEHFASAFTVMMRLAGQPARVVTGYMGGDYNPLGNYLLVRQSDAHAWSEVWFEGRGWVRVDPTAAVAPERVISGGQDARFASAWQGAFGSLLATADWLRRGWNTVLLGYNAARQRSLLSSLGIDASDWRQLGAAFIGGLGLALALTLWLVMRGGPRPSDPLVAAYQRFCARLARAGAERVAHEPPLAFAERAAALLPGCAEELRSLSADYAAQRYAAEPEPAARERLIRALRNFKPRRAGVAPKVAARAR
jgi:transglutaminase-like putative cysteine protease